MLRTRTSLRKSDTASVRFSCNILTATSVCPNVPRYTTPGASTAMSRAGVQHSQMSAALPRCAALTSGDRTGRRILRSSMHANYRSPDVRVNTSYSSVVAFRIVRSRSTQGCDHVTKHHDKAHRVCHCQEALTAERSGPGQSHALQESAACSAPPAHQLTVVH
jgi:hypothetical protein